MSFDAAAVAAVNVMVVALVLATITAYAAIVLGAVLQALIESIETANEINSLEWRALYGSNIQYDPSNAFERLNMCGGMHRLLLAATTTASFTLLAVTTPCTAVPATTTLAVVRVLTRSCGDDASGRRR
jgi:hypothetical protein